MIGFLRRHPAARYLLGAAVAVAIAVLGGFLWIVLGPGPTDFAGSDRIALADYRAANPTGVPPELAGADLVRRGEYLTRAADCEACHTAKGGARFAGGFAFVLPFGTLYSTNITPDKDTGIGNYTDAEFLDALQRGVGRGGVRLYPAMPYASYTYMTDADALAIKAYLFSLRPVHAAPPKNTLAFPFDQRWSMAIWSLFFDPDKRFEPHAQQSAQWNRGAYLAEALAHCGECHTPRNLLQALDNRAKFRGTVQAGWRAYDITPDRQSGIGAWSEATLEEYLSEGHANGHGGAAGPMGEAVDHSLRYLTQSDVAALATYLRSVPPIAVADLPPPKERPAPDSYRLGVTSDANPLGRKVFESACASCHGWTGVSPLTDLATLTGVRAVNDPSAVNVAQVILSGAPRPASGGGVAMPAFGAAYSDPEIAAVANYVTARFGDTSSAITSRDVAKLRQLP
jgi:mono/diheme cytochrome c family protein